MFISVYCETKMNQIRCNKDMKLGFHTIFLNYNS